MKAIRRMSLCSTFALACVLVAGGTALAQSGNTIVGTWKGNIAKSKAAPGTGFKSTTTMFEAAGAGIKGIVDAVSEDGTKQHWTFTANYDGKDSPITGNSPWGDTIALTRVDANTTKSVYKKNGKVTINQTTVVAADGKSRTVTSKGTNAAGKAIDNVTFYDKQ